MIHKPFLLILLSGIILTLICHVAIPGEEPDTDTLRKKAYQQYRKGNYKNAFELYSKLTMDIKNNPRLVGNDFNMAVSCLGALNRTQEVDGFRKKAIGIHKANWRFLKDAAASFINGNHFGYIVANQFKRGYIRGSGERVTCHDRDRVEALRLMTQALDILKNTPPSGETASFYLYFAQVFQAHRDYTQSWRLQGLTDLAETPDFTEGYYYPGYSVSNAPVDEKGDPIYYHIPKSYEAAKNDGERWRWLLNRAVQDSPHIKENVQEILADFLRGQFGVQTLADYQSYFDSLMDQDDTANIYALQTLKDTENLAKLASGAKRFTPPKEFQHIPMYKALAESTQKYYSETALNNLAAIFENRRQYKKAAYYWLESIERHGPGHENYKKKRLDQIQKPWGQIFSLKGGPAGQGASFDYKFRNGVQVEFEAFTVKTEKILSDIKKYLSSNPSKLRYNQFDFGDIGYHLICGDEDKYRGKKAASWTLELKPRKNHFDKIIKVTTPLQKAGAYLIHARMKDGNKSSAVLWVHDTVLVKKQLDQGTWVYVADAVSGKPIPKANVEFFGFRQKRVEGAIRKIFRNYDVHTLNFAEYSDAEGQVVLEQKHLKNNFRWLIMARTETKRLAYLGFSYLWAARYPEMRYNQKKAYIITDRPVYRPGHTVNYKCWLGRASYEEETKSPWANTEVKLTINNPKGEKVLEKYFKTDAWGGFDSQITLPKDATLGAYYLYIDGFSGSSFRVEEYKKPEYEVTVEAPSEPVKLGDPIKAKIKANYYFGAPVTKATVKYKVLRETHRANWYPGGEWDWLYSPGYWWYAYDYTWYPNWKEWGCCRPFYWWTGYYAPPPEVVLDSEGKVDENGELEVFIDTAFAKAVHGNKDHSYKIIAEVRDESRRTIVGQGSVLAARKPFKVYAWVDKGFYSVGDTIRASFNAMTLDNNPVKGKGKLVLNKIEYSKEGAPTETQTQTWDLDTNHAGKSKIQISASMAGQYRLSYKVTDQKGRTEEGGYVFCIRGQGFDGSKFRFNHLELTCEKKEYAPEETVNLMISTDQPDSWVLLFVRPVNGVYLKPKLLNLKNKSHLEQLKVLKSDMPNFFVEAFTISNGEAHSETREIVVPPKKRVLDVEVTSSKEKYKPGEEAIVNVKVKDLDGKPFSGSAVVVIYDKALEYISGGSNVPEIRAFFWKWRKNHNPSLQTSLHNRLGYGVHTHPAMHSIGVFGNVVLEESEEEVMDQAAPSEGFLGRKSLRMKEAKSEAPEAVMAEAAAKPQSEVMVQPKIRSKFADTAFWAANVLTDQDGCAQIKLNMPENLTGWKVKTWVMGHGATVGEGLAEVVTSKDLLLRMQSPRFFVQKDEVVLSANLHNYLDEDKTVKAVLELEGDTLSPLGDLTCELTLPSNGEKRVDWRVKAINEGQAIVRMKVLSDTESDAMEMRFPVYVHGMLKTVSFSNAIGKDAQSGGLTFTVPKERRINDSILRINYSPSLALALVDALPYLAEYPYGCTEQTLNRFVPAVIAQKVLQDMGVSLKQIKEKTTNLNAQELGQRQWGENPVFDSAKLADMVKTGLARLTAMQNSDGGWGWFSGYRERSYPHTTAVVVHGLQTAVHNDMAIVPGVLNRGIHWLKQRQEEQTALIKRAPLKIKPYKTRADNLDAFVFMVLCDAGHFDKAMGEFLYRDRTHLSLYAKAMFGLALEKHNQMEKAKMLLENIEQYLVKDPENQTAYLNIRSSWWYWYGSEYEALAYYLKLLSRLNPKSDTPSQVAKYLINNRRNATYWNSTRDTALCIEALADYIRASGEDDPDMNLEIFLDNKKVKEVTINKENLFTFDNSLILKGDGVETGEHRIEFKKKGKGPLYFNAYLTYFTLEDPITRAGLEVKVNRKIYKLIPKEKKIEISGTRGQIVHQKVDKYIREPLGNLSVLTSGDLVEIELEIESKNDYEYLIFEDKKAAGFEPVQVRSGYVRGGLNAYMELRDERVCFFVRRLNQGKHSISYKMRAEIPGVFSALPTNAFAMYAPELKGNSDEIKLEIRDK